MSLLVACDWSFTGIEWILCFFQWFLSTRQVVEHTGCFYEIIRRQSVSLTIWRSPSLTSSILFLYSWLFLPQVRHTWLQKKFCSHNPSATINTLFLKYISLQCKGQQLLHIKVKHLTLTNKLIKQFLTPNKKAIHCYTVSINEIYHIDRCYFTVGFFFHSRLYPSHAS